MLLSVVIPTWNRAHVVCDAIDSALNQGEVEIIVVDDASSDNTTDVVTRIYGNRIRLMRLRERSGAGAARNAGASVASGELVGFLDSDDVWLPGKLDAELKVFQQFPDAEAVFSDSQVDGSSRFAQNGLLKATRGQVRWADECDWLWTNSTNTVHTCCITVRREALARIGAKLFAEDLDCCEDWEFQMRICHLCRVVVLPKVLAHVRRFDDDSRNGRGIPGRKQTFEQEQILLRDRLTVMQRATWLNDLDSRLAAELKRFQSETITRMSVEEVHIWRGSLEQQALRSEPIKASQFAYFDEQLSRPDWENKLVLDFGGNRGNILQDPCCKIDSQNYYCLDVIKEAIEEGRKMFPEANWFHYDRYNCSFNPTGVANLPIPDFGREFDVILAYSVFTHTTLEEMTDLVAQLEQRLTPGGMLAFTFIDPHWNGNLRWRLERAKPDADVENILELSRGTRWCALVNGELFVENNGRWSNETDSCLTYHVFYTEEFLREQFPRAIVRPPVNDEMQHCCIIRK